MYWSTDPTGRFKRRPVYSYKDMDWLAESHIRSFFKNLRRGYPYPISTDDLTVYLEHRASDLDLYHDFSSESIEGETVFEPGRKPRVRISRRLTMDPRREHRLRFTLAHETAHAVLHSPLYNQENLTERTEREQSCENAGVPAESTNWMESQAGYYASATLIPGPALHHELLMFQDFDLLQGPLEAESPRAAEFTRYVASKFNTSLACAHIRLEKAGIIYTPLSDSELAKIFSHPLPRGLVHISEVLPRVVAHVGIRVGKPNSEI